MMTEFMSNVDIKSQSATLATPRGYSPFTVSITVIKHNCDYCEFWVLSFFVGLYPLNIGVNVLRLYSPSVPLFSYVRQNALKLS